MKQTIRILTSLLVASVATATSVLAETPEEFYKGKTLDVYVGYTSGGGYDLYARLLARHLQKHVPGNPSIVVRNMDGANSMKLANWLYTQAPKDGSVIGTIARSMAFDPLLSRPGTQFDAVKFSWIGSVSNEVSVCVASQTTGVKTLQDAKSKEFVIGSVGVGGGDDSDFPRVINSLLGTRMKIVGGYPGGNEVVLALERGEVSGRCGWSWSSLKASKPDWVANGQVNVLAQLALTKHPDLPNVPLITDLAETDEQRQIFNLIFARQELARPFLAPPGAPADRVKALRGAFLATVNDPDFLAEANKSKMEINPVAGERIQEIVESIYKITTPDIAKKTTDILQVK